MNREIVRLGLSVAVGAAVLLGTGCCCMKGGHGGKDIEITMDQLPASVRPLAEKEIAGGKIKEVEKEMKHGQSIYSITYYDRAGTLMELEYAENGTLISKEKD